MATAYFYGPFLKNQLDGTAVVDFDNDTIKCSLHSSAYTPNQDTHDFFDDATNELAATGGYTAGGKTLTTADVTYDGTSNEVRFVFDDPSWTSATFTARYAVIYKSTGTASTSPLIAYVDFGGDQSVSSGTFTLDFNATAALKITVS